LHIGVCEPNAHRSYAVKIRCVQMRMTGAAQIIETQLVVHNEQNIQRIPPKFA
jgi:hypothetical protein